MVDTKYTLRYLPLFYEDLEQKVVYIAANLQNEKAANDLLDAVESAILERQPVAEAFEPYHSMKERRYPYYRIYVKNFVACYVVIDDECEDKIMEVRRFLYNKQDRDNLLSAVLKRQKEKLRRE
ncbi:MAG: type II toxin-antitoxin system RelE/ParE family toxin [Lachnospiraceae bacterium]|nr:type II toxin-antitoxin system RelE/ParE family toxin [Lachnospiraceae bacterium]MDY5522247.1 type II toxin-antitoxin system RelE/ParE family toxin [Agathobacter sp.]